ncbi:RidA family protein [Cellulomonas sp. JH27-2]|uniref:RidA family protein n=1 Tax=Cellulomonas sp. JH27-2 TaxID=2774139 RepID=UPI0017856A69|nr:Rid family hydrolase [Cellulomonas sp. JH27-2]MBD8058209.1 RidA family protein [Cellulomonas sp. JH27-2]
MKTITRMQPAGLVVSPAFSHVAVVPPGAATIYVGGQNGVDDTGAVVSDDVAEQSRRAVENVGTALAAVGATFDDVVQWTVLIDADADIRAAYGAIAPLIATSGPPPLVTAARVVGLAVPGAILEVAAVAAVVPR